MGSHKERNFRDQSIGIRLTAQGTGGALLAHDLPQLSERLKIRRINKRPMVQTSHLLAVDTSAPITIGVAPVPLTLLHRMAKRPRQVKHHLRILLQLPSRAVQSNSQLPQAPSPSAGDLMTIQKIKQKADHDLTNTKETSKQ